MADTGFRSSEANKRQIMLVAGGALLAALFLFALWYLVIRTPFAPAFNDLKSEAAARYNGDTTRISKDEMNEIVAEATGFQKNLDPSAEEIVGYRDKVIDDFNKGLRYEAYTDPKLAVSGPRLSELHNELGLRDLATLPRTKSEPSFSKS